jgi:hypothetical protein
MTRANHVDRILVNAADFAVSTDVLVQAQFTSWRASTRRNLGERSRGFGHRHSTPETTTAPNEASCQRQIISHAGHPVHSS